MQEQKKQTVHALTKFNHGITNSIITPVEIANVFTSQRISTNGIWDTGATNSVVTKSTATSLGLLPVRRTKVRGVHGDKEVNVYYVNITLNNKNITLNTQVTECDELSPDNSVGMLIGMNIITMGDEMTPAPVVVGKSTNNVVVKNSENFHYNRLHSLKTI